MQLKSHLHTQAAVTSGYREASIALNRVKLPVLVLGTART
jgi:hypothetical protein